MQYHYQVGDLVVVNASSAMSTDVGLVIAVKPAHEDPITRMNMDAYPLVYYVFSNRGCNGPFFASEIRKA